MTTFPPASDDEFGQQLRRAVRALPDAPPALLRAAIGLWPAAAAPTPAALVRALLNRINAVLTFDSWAAPALAPGMRSLRSATRHLLFSAQGRDIDLRITPQAGGFGLTGQVLGPDDAGTVALARLDQPGAGGRGQGAVKAVPGPSPGRARVGVSGPADRRAAWT